MADLAAVMLDYAGHGVLYALVDQIPEIPFERAERFVFGADLLRNASVANAVRRTCGRTAEELEWRYPRAEDERSERERDSLRDFVATAGAPPDVSDAATRDRGLLLSATDVAVRADVTLRRLLSGAPADVVDFVRSQFPLFFVQVFLGSEIRADAEVRSAVLGPTLDAMGPVEDSVRSALEQIVKSPRRAHRGLAQIQAAFAARAVEEARQFDRFTSSLSGVTTTVQAGADIEPFPGVMRNERLLGTGNTRGHLAIFDERNRKLAQYPLRTGTTTLGRNDMNAIQLLDRSVSGKHATLHIDGASVVVTDLGSTNGTYVNGARLALPTEIGFGTRFRIAEYVLEALPPD